MLDLKVARLEEALCKIALGLAGPCNERQVISDGGTAQDILSARRIPPPVRRLIAPARYSTEGPLQDERSGSRATGSPLLLSASSPCGNVWSSDHPTILILRPDLKSSRPPKLTGGQSIP